MKVRAFSGMIMLLSSYLVGCVILLFASSGMSFAQTSISVESAQTAEQPPPSGTDPIIEPSPAICDADCVRRRADEAAQACVPLIEAKAPIDYDWLSRPFGGLFTQAEQSANDGIVRYRGDSIRVLTIQNQWLRHAYECSYDPAEHKIVDVELRPGRLVPPADVANFLIETLKKQPGAQVTSQPIEKGGKVRPQHSKSTIKRHPHSSEPSLISIDQARPHTPQVDSSVSIVQSMPMSKN